VRDRYRQSVFIGLFLAILAPIGCSTQQSSKNPYSLVGKWRSEKKDMTWLIEKMKKANPDLPAELLDPLVEKMKQGAAITDDWQFNPDGTGAYGETGNKERFPITWKALRKSGATWLLELHMNPDDKSSARIVFKGKDRFTMSWLDDGVPDGEVPPDIYNRLR
jgi:hypothetical protein